MGKVVALQMTDKWVLSGMPVSVTGSRWGSPEEEPHRLAKSAGEKRSCAEVENKKLAVMPMRVPNGENLLTVCGYHTAAS